MTREKKDELIVLCKEIDSYCFDATLVKKVERLVDFVLEEIYENKKLTQEIHFLKNSVESKNELIKEYKESYELKKNAMQLMKESYEDIIKEVRKKDRNEIEKTKNKVYRTNND